jgi:diguanylate cyclase (GGDEF)-like protein
MKQLEKDNKTIAKQRDTINTTVFNDILTDVNNRMSFISNYGKGKVKIKDNQAFYFIMFNIDNFNSVNINYGSNSGDMVLSSTADRLKKCFTNSEVYRTGSDEFVVVMKETAGNEGYNKAINSINTARMTLAQPHSIGTGSLSVMYSVSLVKKTGVSDIDSSVLETLKDAMNRGRMSQTNTVSFIDLDFLMNNNAPNI